MENRMQKKDRTVRRGSGRTAAILLGLVMALTGSLPAMPAAVYADGASSQGDSADLYTHASDPEIVYLPEDQAFDQGDQVYADPEQERFAEGMNPAIKQRQSVSLMAEPGDGQTVGEGGETDPGTTEPETPGSEEPAELNMDDVTLPPSVTAYRTGYVNMGTNQNDGVAVVELQGIPEGYDLTAGEEGTSFKSVKTSNSKVLPKSGIILEHNKLYLYFAMGGTSKVTFTLNDRDFTVVARCYRIRISQTSLLMYKKQKITLRVKGVPADTKITYSSSDEKVATVSRKGVVRAKRAGNTVIYASAGGVKVGTVASVTTAKKVRAVKRGRKIGHSSEYSQR